MHIGDPLGIYQSITPQYSFETYRLFGNGDPIRSRHVPEQNSFSSVKWDQISENCTLVFLEDLISVFPLENDFELRQAIQNFINVMGEFQSTGKLLNNHWTLELLVDVSLEIVEEQNYLKLNYIHFFFKDYRNGKVYLEGTSTLNILLNETPAKGNNLYQCDNIDLLGKLVVNITELFQKRTESNQKTIEMIREQFKNKSLELESFQSLKNRGKSLFGTH